MKKEELLERIAKKEQQTEKIHRRIAKWANKCSEEEKKIAETPVSYPEFVRLCKEKGINYSFTPVYELYSALRDLDECEVQLQKYKNQLNIVVDRETGKIPVFLEFFKHYSEQITKYVEHNASHLERYYKLNRKLCDMHNSKRRYLEEMSQEEYDAQVKRLKREEREELELVHPITKDVYFRGEIDYDRLNNILEKDIEAKYWNMIERVTKVTGEIVDATAVHVVGGDINGLIKGKEGIAKVQTILAGGYNQNVIVNVRKGPILHYRLIVTKMN